MTDTCTEPTDQCTAVWLGVIGLQVANGQEVSGCWKFQAGDVLSRRPRVRGGSVSGSQSHG